MPVVRRLEAPRQVDHGVGSAERVQQEARAGIGRQVGGDPFDLAGIVGKPSGQPTSSWSPDAVSRRSSEVPMLPVAPVIAIRM
jgi:hypothetical protein